MGADSTAGNIEGKSVCDRKFDGGRGGNAGARERRLIDDRSVGPLGRGDIVYFAVHPGDVQTMLGGDFVQLNQMRHDVGDVSRTLGNENVYARCCGASAWARRLQDNGVDGLVGHSNCGNLAHLQAGSEELNA